jgi:YD repeat-containing protein
MAYAAKYTYDDLNRLIQVAYDSGQLVSYSYDAGGNMLAVENKMLVLYDVGGKILDKLGKPVAAVIVQVGDKTTTTDAKGDWKITGVSEGNYTVYAGKYGYVFAPQKLSAEGNNTTIEVDLDVSRKIKLGILSAGYRHTCALKSNGTVVCWGYNGSGEATPPEGTFSQVSAGAAHTCGVTIDGAVICWGTDGGQSGLTTAPEGSFSHVSASWGHTCGVKTDGVVACWGHINVPPKHILSQVTIGVFYSCGIKIDGTVVCWEGNTYGAATPPKDVFIQISAGSHHTCGIKTDGTVVCWGNNEKGQSTPPEKIFVQVSAGTHHSCGIKTDGTVACWGNNEKGQATPPDGMFSIVSAGSAHTCGIKIDGTVVCWGNNENGQSTPPQELTLPIDTDNDGVPDAQDAFPNDPSESVDTDSDGTGNNADIDDDNDGLPDTYENQYAFLNPLDPSDASADEDEDGKTNLEEYQQGTEPNVSDNAQVRLVMSASPSPVRVGESFDVTFRILQDGQKVDGEHLGVLFDNEKLHANSVTNSGALDFVLTSDINNAEGFVTFAVGGFFNPLPTGDFDLFTINFTAKEVPAGNTVLQYDPIQQCRGTYEGQYIQQTCEEMTLVIQEPSLVCKVDLQGRPPAPDARWETALKLSGAVSQELMTDDSGYCEFDALPDGEHSLCVKNAHTLQNKVNVNLPLADDKAAVDFGLLLEGDVNDDNIIELTDFSSLRTIMNKCQTDTGFNANADLNVDSCITIDDAKLLQGNYMKVGQLCNSLRSNHFKRKQRDKTNQGAVTLHTSPIIKGLEAGSTIEFDIEVYAETGVDGVAAYLNFPHDKIRVNSLKAGERFDFILQNAFDNTQGHINYAAGVWENDVPAGMITLVTVNATLLETGAERHFSFNGEFPRTTKATFAGQAILDASKEEVGEVVFAMIPQFFTQANTAVTINLATDDVITATDGSNGTVKVKRGNSIVYTPNQEFSGTDSFTYTIGESDQTISVTVDPNDMDSVCYAVADNDGRERSADILVTMDKFTSQINLVGETSTQHIEAIAFNLGATTLFAADAGQLGQLDLDTGTFTPTAQPFGQGNGALGMIAFDDVDGLTFDVLNGVLYATQRLREEQHDVLFKVEPSTGTSIPNAFGEGVDYVVINGPALAELLDIDDIALDNTTGTLYGAANTNGKGGLLVKIDTLTGKATAVGEFGIDNIEGLAFFNNGQLFGSTGTGQGSGKTDNRLYQIDKYTGITASSFSPFSEYKDYEGVGCLTDDIIVFIDGERVYVGSLESQFTFVENVPVGISVVNSEVPGLWTAVMVSKDEQGHLRQQNLSPVPVDAEALRTFFEENVGADSVTLEEDILTVEWQGQIYQGILSYDRLVTDQSSENGEVQFLSIPDANGDGLDDYVIIYPNGQRQTLYFLGVQ